MKKIIIALLVLLFSGDFIFSQELVPQKKNKNFFEIDVSGGFALPIMDLRGSEGLEGFWSFYNYGMSSGFSTSVNTKMSVYTTKMTQLRIYLLLGYSHFSKEDEAAYNVGVALYNWPNSFAPIKTTGTSYLRLNMPHMAFGLEYAVYTDRRNNSSFNFGGDFCASIITGRAYETMVTKSETFNTISSSLRFGFGINVAYAYKFDPHVGFHVGTRMTMPNLFGKTADITDDPGYISLMDKANSVLYSPGRTMAYFNFFGGISFYIGKK